MAAADIRQGGKGPAIEAAANLEAIAALGLVQATAANVPDAGQQGAMPAGLWAASGCGPPTSEAMAAIVKADDLGTAAGPATAAPGTTLSGGNSWGVCSEGPFAGRSPPAAASPGSECPKPSLKSCLARTAGWGSLLSS